MASCKSLGQSFLKFDDPAAISKQLAALIRPESLEKLKKSKKILWMFLKV